MSSAHEDTHPDEVRKLQRDQLDLFGGYWDAAVHNSPLQVMDDDHEQSLVAWANTFTSAEDSPPALATAGAASLSDFASGDSLLPIARTIVGHEDDSSDGTTSRNDSAAADSWVEVFSIVKSAELIDSDAAAPGTDEGQEEKLAAAVTCLEALLRYTVGEECSGRERFIHQIMSLDHAVQTTLRHIIIGTHHQTQCETASEATSPSRESDFGGNECTAAVPMSPAPSTYSMISSPSDRRLSPADFSSEEDVGQADDLSFKSWFSPQTSASARKVRMDRARSSGRAAPVGPRKRQHGTHLNMDTATDTVVQEEEATTRAVALTGVTDVISGSGALAPAGSAASATSAEEVSGRRRQTFRVLAASMLPKALPYVKRQVWNMKGDTIHAIRVRVRVDVPSHVWRSPYDRLDHGRAKVGWYCYRFVYFVPKARNAR